MSRLDDAFPAHEPGDAGEQVRAAVAISGDELRAQLEDLPSRVVEYGIAFARAMRAQMAAKAVLDEVSKAAFLDERETAVALGDRVTEALIDARVAARVDVRAARAALIETEYEREVAKAVCDGLRAKRVSLDSLTQLARVEMPRTPWRDEEPSPDA